MADVSRHISDKSSQVATYIHHKDKHIFTTKTNIYPPQRQAYIHTRKDKQLAMRDIVKETKNFTCKNWKQRQ